MDMVRHRIAAGEASFGQWISLADPVSAELMGRAGFDFMIADCQHGGVNFGNLLPVIQAIELGGTRAVVRTGWLDEQQIMRALDLGASGVIVPMVSTPEQARRAGEACRYPPHGIRSFGPVRSAYLSGGETLPDPLCFVMIETAEALGNLDQIAATAGVDGLFVGPVDLALSLGLGPALVMPKQVLDAIDRVVASCRVHGKIAGCAGLGLTNAKVLVARGVQFVSLGSDAGLVRRGAAADLAEIRSWDQGG